MNNKELYRTNTALLKQLPLFYQPWWLDILAIEWDVALVTENDQVKVVFPYQKEQKAGIKLLRNPILCPYLGPYFLEKKTNDNAQWKIEDQLLKTLWGQIPKHDYLFFSTVPGYDNFLPYHQMGISNTNRITYLLDLAQEEQTIFNGLQSRLRNYIRKAEKGLSVQTQIQPDLKTFISWQSQVFRKKGASYPYTQKQLNDIISVATDHQSSLFQTAFDESGLPQAMLWTPFDQNRGYHLLAATRPESRWNGALALLVWNAIKLLRAKGLKVYDFEGSMDRGIELFFRKFGGRRTIYLQFEQNNSLVWKIKRELLG